MKASDGVLSRIFSDLEKGKSGEFQKYAKRYAKDTELACIWSKFDEESDMVKAKERITKLRASRKIRGQGGTSLALRDRRELVAGKKGKGRD